MLTQASRRLRSAWDIARLLPLFVSFGILKHLVPIRRLVRLAWHPPVPLPHPDAMQRVASLILRIGTFAGWPDRDCLQRSLLLYRELSRLGGQPELVVGFRRSGANLVGHSWVTLDGRLVAEDARGLDAFVPALRFGSHGCLLDVGPAPAI